MQISLENAKTTPTPIAEEKEEEDDAVELGPEGARRNRGVTARGNYLSLDRPDIAYASKEASKRMSKPLEGDKRRLRRIGRYLKGAPRLVQQFQ